MATITVVNNDPFGNNITVYDRNANSSTIWNGSIAANSERAISGFRVNDSGYVNMAIHNQQSGRTTEYGLLHDGERVYI